MCGICNQTLAHLATPARVAGVSIVESDLSISLRVPYRPPA
jgi:hypothetical protein